MDSLTNICLDYVAEIAHKFNLKDFEGLPVPVLRELASHLSAFQLNRLTEIFSSAAISTHAVWSAHVTHRWTKSYQRAATLFHDDLVDRLMPDPRQIYLERHFQWLLGHLATDSPKDLMRDFHVCLPMMRCQGTYVTMKSSQSFCSVSQGQGDLILYAPFVRVLSIMAATPAMIDLILDDPGLLSCLQQSVQRLDLYFVNEYNFARSKELVAALVRHGRLHEFALFNAHIPLQKLTELLDIAAERSSQIKSHAILDCHKAFNNLNPYSSPKYNVLSITEQTSDGTDCSNSETLLNSVENVSFGKIELPSDQRSESVNISNITTDLTSESLHVDSCESCSRSIALSQDSSTSTCNALSSRLDASFAESDARCTSCVCEPHSSKISIDSSVLNCLPVEHLNSLPTNDVVPCCDVSTNDVEPCCDISTNDVVPCCDAADTSIVDDCDVVDSRCNAGHAEYFLDECVAGEETVDSGEMSERRLQDVQCSDEDSAEDLYNWNNEVITPTHDCDDLFDLALMFKNRCASDAGKICSSSKLYKIPTCDEGCFSLTLAYLKADYVVQEALAHVLTLWTGLRKLAILEVNMTNGEVFQKFLSEHIGQGTLSHLILYDSDLCCNVLDVIVRSLLNKTSDEPMQEISLTFFDTQVEAISDDVMSDLRQHYFHGTVHLDLSYTLLSPDKVAFIPVWISHDLALRHLYLSSFQNTEIIPDVFGSILEMSRIETLCLEEVTFSLEMEAGLLQIILQLKSLRSLNLDHCGLSSQLVNSKEFIEGISEHRHLTELHLAYNRLERSGCELLKAICLNNYDRHKFHFLNIGYNLIDGNSLALSADEIYENFKRCRSRDSRIFKLSIGGNLFGSLHASIVQKYLRFVDIVVAEVSDVTDVNPLADHLAQM